MPRPIFIVLLRRWLWLLVVSAVAAALVAWLIASHAGKSYDAGTKLLVGPVSADYSTLQASGALGKTYAELAASRPILAAAARSARLALTPKRLQDEVSAMSNDVTRVVDITVRDRSPRAAARLANAIAAQLLRLRARLPVQHADAAKTVAHDPSLALLSHVQRQAVRRAVGRLDLSSGAGDLAIVERAVPARRPVSRRVGLLTVLAAIGGALVALIYAGVRESPRDAEGWASRHRDAESWALDDFEAETFTESPNGGGHETGEAALEDWLDGIPKREVP